MILLITARARARVCECVCVCVCDSKVQNNKKKLDLFFCRYNNYSSHCYKIIEHIYIYIYIIKVNAKYKLNIRHLK